MIQRPLLSLLLGLSCLLASACAQLPKTAEPAPVPMSLQGAHPLVEARVNGATLRFLLDTGADQNVVSAQAVAKLGLVPSAQTLPGRGAAGNFQAVPWVRLGDVRIGEAQLRDQVAFVVPLPEEAQADGILGLPLFTQFVATLDYAAGTLTLDSPHNFRAAADLEALPLRTQGGKLLVRADVGGVDGWYSLDTGAGNAVTMFTPTVERHRLRRSFGPGLDMVTGISPGGFTRGELVRVPQLRLGPYRLDRVVVELSQASEGYFAHPLPDTQGNLGGELWRHFSLTIDAPDGRLFLRPNAAYAEPFAATRSGLVARKQGNRFEVVDVVAASPAAIAGLAIGDAVVAVNGRSAGEWTSSSFRDLLGGAPGTKLDLSVVDRSGRQRHVTLTLKDLL